jgi:hypothetical protein
MFKPEEKFDGQKFIDGINAKYGRMGSKDMEETLERLWRDILGSDQKARRFMDTFGGFLWPNQLKDAMTWMYRRWSKTP